MSFLLNKFISLDNRIVKYYIGDMKYKGDIKTHFDINNQGTLVLFVPKTHWAKDFWEEKVDPNCQTFGDGYCVEHRYAQDIMDGIQDELET